ncbi:MAG: N-acetylneuraminate synthase [Coriobacteriales bacterium]
MPHVYLIAEIGCNHNGNPALAMEMIEQAKECGADAVKFQSFSAASLVSKYAQKARYQKETTNGEESQLEMLQKLELSNEDYLHLRDYAKSLGLDVFSTPFDLNTVELLKRTGQTIWKIPSGEITNLPYLRSVAKVQGPGRRFILSSGMSTIDEITACVAVLQTAGVDSKELAVLHCNTEYPTPDQDVNISAICDLRASFPELEIGFSDHSLGTVAAIQAVALGATIIEKHFTLDKSLPGPDHRASSTPDEFRKLCVDVRRAELMAGCGKKIVTESEAKNKVVARKSIVAARFIREGDRFTSENLTCKRPGCGISPMFWDQLCGLTAQKDFAEDELIVHEGFCSQE